MVRPLNRLYPNMDPCMVRLSPSFGWLDPTLGHGSPEAVEVDQFESEGTQQTWLVFSEWSLLNT